MELNPLRPSARPDALGAVPRPKGQPPADGTASPQPPADEAVISLEARRRAQLDGAVGAAPEVRETLVAELRAAILSDRYELDPEAIARGLAGQDPHRQDAASAPDA